MTDIVESMRAQSVGDCIAYTEFMLNYKKGVDCLYCFYEGHEDRTYYPLRIELLTNKSKYLDYVCGGKDEVKSVYRLVRGNSNYSEAKVGFFVDSDFDNEVLPNDFYQTSTYSIENLYCLEESVEKILRTEFKISHSSNDIKICLETYLKLLQSFNDKMLIINAWLACQTEIRNKGKLNTRLAIDKTVKTYFTNIISPDLKSISEFTEFSTLKSIEEIFVNSPKVGKYQLMRKVEYLKTLNYVEGFRGKFLITFLTQFFSRLQTILGTKDFPLERKYSCSIRFETATICTTLSQYAITSPCLKKYILSIA